MKLKEILLINFLTLGLMSAQEWTYFLDQRNLQSDGFIRKKVGSEGDMTSEMVIPAGGSEFTIWARKDRGSKPPIMHPVGVDTVGAYLPTGNLSITTPDPYSGGIPRTRVDQGFTLHGNVDGLKSSDPDSPLAAQKVLLDHRVEVFESNGKTLIRESDSELFEQSFVEQNGKLEESYVVGSLPGDDAYTESGIETFKLFALPDGQIAQMEVAEAQVQIWPLASASSRGWVYDVAHQAIPDITFDLQNLYPKSETYLRYYSGSESTESVGTRILDVQILVDQNVPRNGSLVLKSPERFFGKAGVWTIEVLTETPFGIERLDFLELNFDSGLEIRGGLNFLK